MMTTYPCPKPATAAARWRPFHLILLLFAVGIGSTETHARPFRVNMIPNGSAFGCLNCHFGSGGPRNEFGKAVEARVTPGGSQPFWDAVLASLDSDGDGAANGEELGDPDGDGSAIPGVEVYNPGNAASTPPPPAIEIDVAAMQAIGAAGALSWSGGRGPFLVRLATSVEATDWMPLLTTDDREAYLPLIGGHGFFRIEDQIDRPIIPFTVWLSAEAVNGEVDSPGSGYGVLSLDGNTLTYHIPYQGLVAGASAAHIHGPADSGMNEGVLQGLAGAAGVAGALSGSAEISADTREALLTGRGYVNIHTPSYQGGEIRGQVAPVEWQADLSGANAVDPIETTGTGTATFRLVGNQLFWSLSWENLSSAATAAHIHGPADVTQNASVLVALPGVSGTSGSASGTATLTLDQLLPIIDGLTYVNVHTPNHQSGEIRGQIAPSN
jgi:hypothetical protein